MAATAGNCVTCSVRGPHCFCSLSGERLRQLQALGSAVRFGADEVVIREDARVERVYVICRGRVKLSTCSADGKLLIVRIAGPGDVLGLVSLLNGLRHKVTVETLEPCEMKAIRREDFEAFMASSGEVGRNAAVSVAWEHEGMLLTARRLATSSSAAGKLANALLDWGRMEGAADTAGPEMRFRMPLTHEELGSMAGISRETVTRVLGQFRKEGLVAVEGEMMRLSAPARMEAKYC